MTVIPKPHEIAAAAVGKPAVRSHNGQIVVPRMAEVIRADLEQAGYGPHNGIHVLVRDHMRVVVINCQSHGGRYGEREIFSYPREMD